MTDETTQQEETTVPEKFQGIVDQLSSLSVLDMAELVKILEKKFGVSAAAPMVVAGAAPAATTAAEAEEEKTNFDVVLDEAGPNKIAVIKTVREFTEKGLKEAKDLVDAAPKTVLEGAPKEKAEEVKKKLEEAGAKVTLR